MVPEVGQRFGPYEILGKLGSGGMGLVFRAWDERLHRQVAIKVLHDDYTMPGMRERFLQEARAASALNHPNLCMVFDIGEQDRNPYLVMELLTGETLKARIARSALSAEEIVRYSLEITNALAVAHARGIVHRDIKPANIFLVPMPNGKSQAKVLDFGLAKIALEKRGGWECRTLDMSIAGSTVGTLAYMSPEQARGESLDLRTDLFSLGVVMYEMATRQAPFKGTTSGMMMAELLRSTPEPVTIWNDSIPRDLEKVILEAVGKGSQGPVPDRERVTQRTRKNRRQVRTAWLVESSHDPQSGDCAGGRPGGPLQNIEANTRLQKPTGPFSRSSVIYEQYGKSSRACAKQTSERPAAALAGDTTRECGGPCKRATRR